MEEYGGGISGGKLVKKEGATLKPLPGIAESLAKRFAFEPTAGQLLLFRKMEAWFADSTSSKPTFILKGYAGTGKTSFLSTLINVLPQLKLQLQMMAPTGRASKVMSGFTRRISLTIHKRVFRFELDETGYPTLKRQKNSFHKTLFVVDEASMVGNQQEYGSKGILEELVRYVFENKGNRLLIIGDTAQLPPVGMDLSLALKADEMQMRYGLDVVEHELSDVVRQELDSGILENATALREVIRGAKSGFILKTAGYPDIFKMPANRVFEGIEYAYAKYGMERTLVLTRTNKQAMQYNRGIRGHILYREEELESGDWVIVVKNNYSILDNGSKTGFVANGDLCTVKRVGRPLDDYPLRLTSLELTLSDANEDEECLDGYAFTELLYSELPQLSEEQVRTFQQVLMAEWELEEKSVRKRWAKMKTDPIANALQIKFGYALTCHKSQGGQWDAVFVDHGFLKEGQLDTEFYRWFYTAVTRARKEVFIINPDKRLLEENVHEAD